MLLLVAIVSLIPAAGCFIAAIAEFYRATANLAPGVEFGRTMVTPGKTDPELYTAEGQRHLTRYNLYLLAALLLCVVAMVVIGFARRVLT